MEHSGPCTTDYIYCLRWFGKQSANSGCWMNAWVVRIFWNTCLITLIFIVIHLLNRLIHREYGKCVACLNLLMRSTHFGPEISIRQEIICYVILHGAVVWDVFFSLFPKSPPAWVNALFTFSNGGSLKTSLSMARISLLPRLLPHTPRKHSPPNTSSPTP